MLVTLLCFGALMLVMLLMLCRYSNKLEGFFRVIDSLNLLRGFFMFLIFVCKENVKNKVKARFGLVRGEQNGSVKTLHETTEMTEMAVG